VFLLRLPLSQRRGLQLVASQALPRGPFQSLEQEEHTLPQTPAPVAGVVHCTHSCKENRRLPHSVHTLFTLCLA